MRRVLISEVISSFKEALKFSQELFSIRGDYDLGGLATSTSWFEEQGFSTIIGETKTFTYVSITFLLIIPSFLVSCC